MVAKVVEAAERIINDKTIHCVVEEFPWLVEAVAEKQKWWRDDVKAIAAVDSVKPTNDILKLGWNELIEADVPNLDARHMLVELGDITVFLVAAIVRDVIAGNNPSGVVKMEEMYLAKYVDEKLKNYDDPVAARKQMIEMVFSKIKNNFNPAFSPPAPEGASHTQANIVYKAGYSASRTIRKYAAQNGHYDENRGLPDEFATVFSTNGETPEHLIGVKNLSLSEMKKVGRACIAAYGKDYMNTLFRHWELTASGMIGDLQEVLNG